MESVPHEVATTLRVLVLTDRPEEGEMLAQLLAKDDGLRVRVAPMAFGEGVRAVGAYEPHLLVVADTAENPAAIVEQLDEVAPGTPSVVILVEGDVKGAQDCTLAGAAATLLKPLDRQALVQAVWQVHARETRRKQHLSSALDAGQARPQRPRVVAIHGAKGGVGATTLACNVAVALRQVTGRRVALIDGDVLSGDARVMFDIDSPHSLSDLLPQLKELDADLVMSLLAGHASGVRVLLAPDQLQRAEAMGGEDMQRTLAGLKPYFDYQIVDTQSHITPVTLAALDEADLIVLIVTPEIVALRNAARFLQLAAQLAYPAEKIMLVANRAASGKDITPAVVEQYLGRPVAMRIPSDGPALVGCMNAGDLIVEAHPRHRVSTAITHLAQEIATTFGWHPSQERSRQGERGGRTTAAGVAHPARFSQAPHMAHAPVAAAPVAAATDDAGRGGLAALVRPLLALRQSTSQSTS